MSYLISIAIGPVQEFIASARRSRDLWFGSWLLSELSKAAAEAVVENQENNLNALIFPAPKNIADLKPFSSFNAANKILTKVSGSLSDITKAIKTAVDKRRDCALKEAFSHVHEDFDRTIAEQQISDLLEFYWVAVEVEEDADGRIRDYAAKRSQIEALLASRKTTRNFVSTPWQPSANPKSSLDGQRESVIPEKVYKPKSKGGLEWSEKQLRDNYGVRKGERLCGVGLLKRHGMRMAYTAATTAGSSCGVGLLKRHGMRGEDMDHFFSTSHVASLSLMDHFKSDDMAQRQRYKQEFTAYLSKLQKLDVSESDLGNVPKPHHDIFGKRDGHMLFTERLREFVDDEAAVASAKEALACFLQNTVGKRKRPLPYYALLHADGDRMGKVIDSLKTEAQHRLLSQVLADFSSDVDEIVKRFGGSPIYSGGDDVLAFLPLHQSIKCAQELAKHFKQTMQSEKDEQGDYLFCDSEGKTPTLSAGLVVAHHIDPLSDTLELARQAEKVAKSIDGKDALAITVSKRSGVDRTVKGKWGKLDTRLIEFIEWHCNGDIPDGAAYELERLTLQLSVDKNSPRYEVLEKAINADALRIWKRKRVEGGGEDVSAVIRQQIQAYLENGLTISELAHELIVARIFAEAKNLATPPSVQTEEAHGGNPQ